ncbi:glycosyltransferase family 2 protein [Limosilactobacillus fermentum]|uniref:glycosyltransferase family 2 protein n=1 Tax=Limosilactobacillus fermentum TaxID=1613 RepID=UPI0021CAF225|nr:glycosyltransferase family 2 protein [Limosilactobacillus fermentum]
MVAQDYMNLQIILVNDGSTDHSLEICKKWLKNDSRIQIINKSNGGLSDARNYGLRKARGKWIAMVDGDDFVKPNYISAMIKAAKKYGVLLVNCGSKRIISDKVYDQPACENTEKINSTEFWKLYYTSQNYRGNYQAAWSKLYSRKIFDSGIRYKKGIVHEDIDILYDLIAFVGEIVVIPETLYCYQAREGSITDKLKSNYEVDYTNLELSNILFKKFFENGKYLICKYALEDTIALFHYNVYASNLKAVDYKKLLTVKKKIISEYCQLRTVGFHLKLSSLIDLSLFSFWFILSKVKKLVKSVIIIKV